MSGLSDHIPIVLSDELNTYCPIKASNFKIYHFYNLISKFWQVEINHKSKDQENLAIPLYRGFRFVKLR